MQNRGHEILILERNTEIRVLEGGPGRPEGGLGSFLPRLFHLMKIRAPSVYSYPILSAMKRSLKPEPFVQKKPQWPKKEKGFCDPRVFPIHKISKTPGSDLFSSQENPS